MNIYISHTNILDNWIQSNLAYALLKNSSCICNVDQSKERSSLFLSAGFDGVLFVCWLGQIE